MINNGENINVLNKVSQAFVRMGTGYVKCFADVVLNMKDDNITFFEGNIVVYKITVPHINSHIKSVVNILKEQNFEIYVISLTNQYLVETIVKCLMIPVKNCFGIKYKMTKFDDIEVLSEDLINPLPAGKEIEKIYKQEISGDLPLFTAGSSSADL